MKQLGEPGYVGSNYPPYEPEETGERPWMLVNEDTGEVVAEEGDVLDINLMNRLSGTHHLSIATPGEMDEAPTEQNSPAGWN